jgi:hypothetical protein
MSGDSEATPERRWFGVHLPHHRFRHHDSLVHALEDLDDDTREQVKDILTVPGTDGPLRTIWDVLDNAGHATGGEAEKLIPFLHNLYSSKAYTYRLSDALWRGSRPSPEKIQDLYDYGVHETVNLCAEMRHGDAPIIQAAGLEDHVGTSHIRVTDGEVPEDWQVVALLDLLQVRTAWPVYLHCEQGVGRTGVMTACYRMAVMGWDGAAALAEAERFGCHIPTQRAYVTEFSRRLQENQTDRSLKSTLGDYPLRPLGSVQPTEQQLASTVDSCLDEPPLGAAGTARIG